MKMIAVIILAIIAMLSIGSSALAVDCYNCDGGGSGNGHTCYPSVSGTYPGC